MKKIIHKISAYINILSLSSVIGVLFYGLYVMWTRADTSLTRIELNIVLTIGTFIVLNFAVFMFTDD